MIVADSSAMIEYYRRELRDCEGQRARLPETRQDRLIGGVGAQIGLRPFRLR
jgi:hypothetical protein